MTWADIPLSIREPIKSGVISFGLSLQNAVLVLIGAAAADGQIGSPGALWAYCASHWWGVALAFILPVAYRAKLASDRAANTVQLPSGGTAVITPPKG